MKQLGLNALREASGAASTFVVSKFDECCTCCKDHFPTMSVGEGAAKDGRKNIPNEEGGEN